MKLQKDPLPFEDQVNTLINDYNLKSRTNDLELFKSILINMNYYCIKGYGMAFNCFDKQIGKIRNDKPIGSFTNNITIEDIYNYFNLDIEFKIILFNAIHLIEKNVRSIFSNFFACKYGFRSVVSDAIHFKFNNPTKVYNTFAGVIQKNYLDYIDYKIHGHDTDRFDNVILWHIENYENDYPLWVLVEYMDLGKLIFCVKNIKDPEIMTKIRKNFGFESYKTFINSLKIIKEIRNKISHFHRLVGTTLPWNCTIDGEIDRDYITNTNNNHIFTFLLLIKKFMIKCDKNRWMDIKQKIIDFLENHSDFRNALHSPPEWKELINK